MNTFITLVWMAWVIIVGLVEALVKIFNKDIYLLMDEEGWGVTYYNYGPDKEQYKIEEE